jgi:DNA-binding transcriptional LysR family regulator
MAHQLDFRRLRSFVAVAETLHFGRAAERLNIAQPALSQQIQQLERDLDAQLLVRDRRSVRLTPVGELFLGEARKALEQMERASLVALRAKRGEIGHVEISHASSIAYSGLLSQVCYAFQQASPDVRLDVLESDLEHQLQDLSDSRVDVAFIRLPAGPLPENAQTLTLDQERIFACLRTDHPLAKGPVDLRKLAAEPFILTHLRRGFGFFDAALRACHTAGFEPRVVHRSHQFVSIVALVAAGRGVALVPESVCRLQLPDVVYRPLLNNDARSEVAIAYRRNEDSPAVLRFIALCRGWRASH